MLTIDGSCLEGGGQIIRVAVSLSVLTNTPVQITHIRARRDNPGLAAQHIAAIRAVSSLCSARVTGLSLGSSHLTFIPGSPERTRISLDVVTAGSVPLIIQAWLPVALLVGGSITVKGGTEVQHSPTIDYLDRVFLPLLRRCGARVQLFILERGYYPKGGGLVEVIAEPSQLSPLEISGEEIGNGIVSCTSNLPDHVAERQAISARNRLHEELGFDPPVIFDRRSGLSTGSSCTAWRGAKGGLALGKRGFPAEKVGLIAADQLIEEVRAGGVVDTHLADQLLIYLAQYGGEYSTGRLTLHAQTMQWLLGEFGFSVGISAEDVVEMRG